MISVIIPSIRPENLEETIKKFIISQGWDCVFEIVLVTDFDIDYKIWVNRYCDVKVIKIPRNGPTDAICKGIEASKGEYIFFINDQCSVSPNGLSKMLAFSKKHNDRVIVGHRNTPITPMKYFGVDFEPYPFIHKDLVKELGGYYRPEYKHFYADPDLAMRSSWLDIPIKKCPGVSVHRTCDGSMDYQGHVESVNKNYKNDMETFINRWKFLGKPFKEISPGKRSWLWCRLLELMPY